MKDRSRSERHFLIFPNAVPTLLFMLILACVGMPAFALALDAQVARATGGISVTISAGDPPIVDVLHTLRDGMRAEITFVIQVYHRSDGLFRLFGDRLVQEVRVTRAARWDAFSSQYVISGTDRPDVRTSSNTDFEREFFDLSGFVLPWSFVDGDSSGDSAGSSYLMVQMQVRPMKLVPALAILSFLRMEREIASGWQRIEIPPQSHSGG